jgi:hypothetical protein
MQPLRLLLQKATRRRRRKYRKSPLVARFTGEVQDNLSIHSKASLYEAFPVVEARRLVERFEWHYTPKHGS